MSKKIKKITGKKLGALIAAVVALLIIAVVVVSAAAQDKIFKNVYVLDTELSSLTQKDAEDLLFKQYYETDPKVTVKYKDASADLYFSEFGELDYATTAGEAFKVGRKFGILSKVYAFCTPFQEKTVEFTTYIEKQNIINKFEELYNTDNEAYKDTSYKVEDGVLFITAGRSGDYCDTENAISEIADAMKKLQDVEIELEVKQGKKYEGVDVKKIYDEVCKEPKNAYYDEKNGKIVPHVVGYSFDIGEVKKLVENIKDDETVKVELTVRLPEITEAKLTGEMFSDTLASYSTKYNPSEVDRSYNMLLASNKVNGTVLQPGGEFSYNKVVGERTVAAGYRNAKVFENGRVVDGLGGGICQVSSTIYNAVLYANLEITERKNHSFSVVYTPLGQDATVVMGAIDFRFKNNTKYPIKIVSSVSGGLCTVTILGTMEQPYKVEIVSTVTSTKPYETVYVQDDTLAFGEEKVVQTGQTGYNVSSVRKVYLNGELIKTEKLSPSYYSARKEEIARNENAVDPNAPAVEGEEGVVPEGEVPPTEQNPTTEPQNPEAPETEVEQPPVQEETQPETEAPADVQTEVE
jgi:vancomycin resistance protein YoaR